MKITKLSFALYALLILAKPKIMITKGQITLSNNNKVTITVRLTCSDSDYFINAKSRLIITDIEDVEKCRVKFYDTF